MSTKLEQQSSFMAIFLITIFYAAASTRLNAIFKTANNIFIVEIGYGFTVGQMKSTSD